MTNETQTRKNETMTRDLTQDILNEGDRVKGTRTTAGQWGTILEVDGWNALVKWDGNETCWHPYIEIKRT